MSNSANKNISTEIGNFGAEDIMQTQQGRIKVELRNI